MKKIIYYILFIFNIISIIFLFLNLHTISNEIILLPLIIIICFEIFMMYKRRNILKINFDKEKIIISIFLCILFMIMLPITLLFERLYFGGIIVKIVVSFSLFISLFHIIYLLFLFENKSNLDTTKMRKKIMIIIVIISLIFIGSTSTGFYDIDFPGIWNCDIGCSDFHTFGFSYLIYFCQTLFNNSYPVIILNFILYIYFCNYALKLLEREIKNKNILLLFLIINIFTIVGFDQLRYVKKDILFSLGFCNLILTIIDYLTLNKFTKGIVIKLIIFSIFTVLFRHGGLYLIGLIFTIFLIILLLKKQYMQLIYIIIIEMVSVGSYFTLNYIGYDVLNGYKTPDNVKYTVPIYQVGAFANAGYEFSDSERAYLEQYLPIDYMASNFIKYFGDALARDWNLGEYAINSYTFNYSQLIKINFNLFIHKPLFYLHSLFDLNNILWKIERNSNEWFIYFYKYEWNYESTNSLKGKTIMWRETPINKIVDPIVDIGLKGFLFDFRVRGAFPLFIIILSTLLFINKRKYKYIFPVLCILIWYILLFLSLPLGITRYCLPFINIYPFIFCLALGLKKAI